MRQLILAGNVAYPSAATLDAVPAGACGFYYNNDGQLAADSDGSHITREGMLVLGRAAADGGPVVLPVFKNNFSYVKGVYHAATAFKATIKIAAPTKIGEYSLIVVKKGQQFNYRNKWTATVLVTDVTMTADALAKALADQINNNTIGHGCTANASSSTITVDAQEKGVDYDIVGADWLIGQAISITSAGIPAYGDATYVTDLANKAAADAGFEYTFYTWTRNLYPNYPLNPLKATDVEDAGYTIFTLRFAEPRNVKTRDEVVNQIIQVAFPTEATGITAFETACKALAGIA